MEKAIFLDRPNRFTMVCRLNRRAVRAYLPNPGRMWELLLPEAVVYLERVPRPENHQIPYVAVAVERDGYPVMVHTHRTNDLVDDLLKKRAVPGLEGAEVIRRETRIGKSRFDFLLKRGNEEIVLEVKSCTLFGRDLAMFPDAVTARGKRHIEELGELSDNGTAAAVLFLICWPRAKFFMPDYHTDLEFAGALLAVKTKISVIPLAVELNEDLSLSYRTRVLEIPWDLVEEGAKDRGAYVLILHLSEEADAEIGNIGSMRFRKGYYIYVGSAMKNLSKRIHRHKMLRKKEFWHIDSLRAISRYHAALPIRTGDSLECELARAVREISEWEVPRFGSSDCSCHSHLYGMTKDPIHSARFISLLQYFRMDRLTANRPPRFKPEGPVPSEE